MKIYYSRIFSKLKKHLTFLNLFFAFLAASFSGASLYYSAFYSEHSIIVNIVQSDIVSGNVGIVFTNDGTYNEVIFYVRIMASDDKNNLRIFPTSNYILTLHQAINLEKNESFLFADHSYLEKEKLFNEFNKNHNNEIKLHLEIAYIGDDGGLLLAQHRIGELMLNFETGDISAVLQKERMKFNLMKNPKRLDAKLLD